MTISIDNIPFPKLEKSKLLAEIRANHAKLDACPKHFFDAGDPPYKFGQKFTCHNCGGVMDGIAAMHYTKGYAAAGKDPNEVFKNFF